MTNPGGLLAPDRKKDMAPLYPRHHLQVEEAPRRPRDLQVWPRHFREMHDRQELRRTAPIKHHLRAMADRNEMLTTYEHDFAVMTRPNPKGSSTGFGASFYGTGGRPPARNYWSEGASSQGSLSPSRRIAAPRPWESGSPGSEDDDARSIRSSRSMGHLGATERDPAGTLGYSTFRKMDRMRSQSVPMKLNLTGWGDLRWSPKSHPSMVMGMTSQTSGLEQMTKIMNLRAPDVPFCTR